LSQPEIYVLTDNWSGQQESVIPKEKAAQGARRLFIKRLVAHTQNMAAYEKVYVTVMLHVDTDGNMKPVAIEWANGVKYEISKITDVRQTSPQHVGSVPAMRYTILVNGYVRDLYHEKYYGRWYVEKMK
jgi:hypothetical protein